MISARTQRYAFVVAALLVTTGAAACAASRPLAATPTTTLAAATTATRPPSPAATASPATTTGGPATTRPEVTATTVTATSATATTPPAGPTSSGTLVPPTDAQWARFDEYLHDRLLGAGDFAFGVAVSIDGVMVHASSFGDRNSPNIVPPPPEPPTESSGESTVSTTTTSTTTTSTAPPVPLEPVSATDRFRIASISKVITGTVVLQLVADGSLGLDEPVGELLGDHLGVDVTGRPPAAITVRQLLSHTAGFSEFDNTFFSRGVESCREAAARGLREGVQFDPGTTYNYSNMNFCMLSIVIEVVTGQPYETVVQDRLLDPLGINGMRLAGTFDPRPDEVIHPSFPNRNYMEVLSGAGSWVGTPADVVKIVDSLDNRKPGFHPLPDDLAQLMRKPVSGIVYNSPTERWYGLATIAFANQSWGHTGTVENTHSMVVHRPDGMTWAILVSGNYPEETDDLEEIFQDAIDHAAIDAPAPTTSTTTTTSTTSTTTTTIAPTSTAS
jgi:D-alanyl-D-alanine carboxypeptidase